MGVFLFVGLIFLLGSACSAGSLFSKPKYSDIAPPVTVNIEEKECHTLLHDTGLEQSSARAKTSENHILIEIQENPVWLEEPWNSSWLGLDLKVLSCDKGLK